jgi:thiol-disulfide isomerase/thioredoxin
MRMSIAAVSLVLAALSAATGCSSATPAPTQDPGVARGNYDPSIENRDVNTYNVAYPSADIGIKPATWKNWDSKTNHTKSSPGQRIKNFKFLGYPEGDVAGGLKTVALADYFDPEGKNPTGVVKVIHIQAAGTWCSACRSEASSLLKLYGTLREQGVVWLTTVAEGGTPGTDSTLADLTGWLKSTKSVNTTMLDPGNFNLGVFYKAQALPWNVWIDARTMEIFDYHEGAPNDLKGDIDNALAKFNANAARD